MNKLNKKLPVAAALLVALASTGAFAQVDSALFDKEHFNGSPRRASFEAIEAFRKSPVAVRRASTRSSLILEETTHAHTKPTTVWTKLYGILNSLKQAIFG